jgi:toxin ParE1/3/4
MSSYRFTPQAAQDLNDIYDYIAQYNAASAARIIQRLQQTCQQLGQTPGMGRTRDDLQQGLLSFPSGNYVIFYRIGDDGIEIVRILHGAGNISPSLFNSP